MSSLSRRVLRLEQKRGEVSPYDHLSDEELEAMIATLDQSLLPIVRKAIEINESEETAEVYRLRLTRLAGHLERKGADIPLNEMKRTFRLISERWPDADPDQSTAILAGAA